MDVKQGSYSHYHCRWRAA